MYNCDYEYDILGVLRLLRYLHMYDPRRAASLKAGETEFSPDDILEFLYINTGEIFDDFYEEYDDINGSEVIHIYDRAFQEYIKLNRKLAGAHHSSEQAAQRKLEDLATFFLADRSCGIYDMTLSFEDDRPYIQLIFAEGCCEPQGLVMALTDMMHYLHRKNAQMERVLEAQGAKIVALPEPITEEAA